MLFTKGVLRTEFIIDEEASILKEEPEMRDLVWIDPVEFLWQTTDPKWFINNRLQGPLHKEESLQNLLGRLRNGLPISPPWITVNITLPPGKIVQHEGRHRAVACCDLGIKQIPLVIFYERWEEDKSTMTGMRFIHVKPQNVPSQMRKNLLGFKKQWA